MLTMHQETTIIYIGLAGITAVAFTALGYLIRKLHAKTKIKSAEDKANKMVEDAKVAVDRTRRDAELQAKDLL